MLDQAVQLVRPENEGLVRYALDTYKFLSLAQQHPRIGGPGLLGHYKSSDGYF
nr:putative methyltransferase NSUN6 [Tanacetum cinerariifolium]